jgi:nitrogen regulatory protein PII-like uncharacterized protein
MDIFKGTKYWYYVANTMKTVHTRIYVGTFFDFKTVDEILTKDGITGSYISFFKEITKEEYTAFYEKFKK